MSLTINEVHARGELVLTLGAIKREYEKKKMYIKEVDIAVHVYYIQ